MKSGAIVAATLVIGILLTVASANAEIAYTRHIISSGINSWSTMAADMDGDGDLDVVGSGRLDNRLMWYENNGDQDFTPHVITDSARWAMAIVVIDVDSDGDMDIVAAVQGHHTVNWYENDGRGSFAQRSVHRLYSATYVHAADVDSDGDVDVLGAACEMGSNRIVWFENDGNENFTEHIVKRDWDHANSVFATDVDRDGDVDILGTAARGASGWGDISWFENDGNENFTERPISLGWARPSNVHAADIDLDGDVDVFATICFANQLVWFENTGDEEFEIHVVAYGLGRPRGVRAVDMDGDGDMDLMAVAIDGGEIAWWENDGHQVFTKHSVATDFSGATEARAVDLDGDGDLDVLGAAQYDDQIAWWETEVRLPSPRRATGRRRPVTP
jgi:hypothetical protein